jgi:hypothetical protein
LRPSGSVTSPAASSSSGTRSDSAKLFWSSAVQSRSKLRSVSTAVASSIAANGSLPSVVDWISCTSKRLNRISRRFDL